VAILATYAPAKRAPTICPLWKSDDKSPIFHYWTQSVNYWHWYYMA
jgi:hypothetical protein